MKNAAFIVISFFFATACFAQKKGKGKDKDKKAVKTEYITAGEETPVADTATKFSGLIKYNMRTDDAADRDSMFIYFGENKIRITMFNPGYQEGQVFETNMIANF